MDSTTSGADRRTELLERVVDQVLRHGITQLTLRGLATAVGSNNRMLLYYFGSVEDLVVTALQHASARFPAMTRIMAEFSETGVPLPRRMERAWATLADPENRPYHRLFFEVFGAAGYGRRRSRELLETIGTEWAASIAAAYAAEGVPTRQAEAMAHETVALWRGFQATLLSIDDDQTVERAALPALSALARRVQEAAASDGADDPR